MSKNKPITSQAEYKKDKYREPMSFSWFKFKKDLDSFTLHMKAKYKDYIFGGEVVEIDTKKSGYMVGKFKLYRNDWPNLCNFIDSFMGCYFVTEFEKSKEGKYIDENFHIYTSELLIKEDDEMTILQEMFGE